MQTNIIYTYSLCSCIWMTKSLYSRKGVYGWWKAWTPDQLYSPSHFCLCNQIPRKWETKNILVVPHNPIPTFTVQCPLMNLATPFSKYQTLAFLLNWRTCLPHNCDPQNIFTSRHKLSTSTESQSFLLTDSYTDFTLVRD